MFDILVSCLSGENEYAVHGAMRVLTEFTSDLTDNQLPNVGPVILQEMYRIFQNENVSLLIFTFFFFLIKYCPENSHNTDHSYFFSFLAIFY